MDVRIGAHNKLHSLDLVPERIHAKNAAAATGTKVDQSTP